MKTNSEQLAATQAQKNESRRKQIVAKLRRSSNFWLSWPWLVAALSGGILIGMSLGIPLFPEPTQFAQVLWITLAGSAGTAAVTVIGTLWVTSLSKQSSVRHAAKALAIHMVSSSVATEAMVVNMGPIPNTSDGTIDRKGVIKVDAHGCELLHTGAQYTNGACEQALKDIELYKPACIGIDLTGRQAISSLERTLALLHASNREFQELTESCRRDGSGATFSAVYAEMYRQLGKEIYEAAKRLRAAKVE